MLYNLISWAYYGALAPTKEQRPPPAEQRLYEARWLQAQAEYVRERNRRGR